ncbi:MAG: bifunctional proline dehydrogenase/L-glutamate gamma-semialdehyde dehydrogenase PutA, partial [Pseudomonadota bacterium]
MSEALKTTSNTATDLDKARQSLRQNYRVDEVSQVRRILASLDPIRAAQSGINARAHGLVEGMRASDDGGDALEDFMNTYDLSTREGVALMCLAEALLRIPDADTANKLIKDKLGEGEWRKAAEEADGLFANASTWALMLSGKVLRADTDDADAGSIFDRLVARLGQPVIRQAMLQAMRIMGKQFVMGRTLEEALDRAQPDERVGTRHSYDMLGEAARTAKDAERYFKAYEEALATLAQHRTVAAADGQPVSVAPGISVKLSALHPRYSSLQADRAVPLLAQRLKTLALAAKAANIGLCVDAEEARRLDISLDIIEQVYTDPELDGWEGFGLAIQAYKKRAVDLVDWLVALAERHGRRMMVRLVKGAYWDSEIKWSQEGGFNDYPVFTRKHHTDLSYLACAAKMLDRRDVLFPQFATHNAHTVAAILELADQVPFDGQERSYEFQRLHGMGEELYAELSRANRPMPACRVYAPVGSHEDLLPYLVRRLLENGANTSFVNRLQDAKLPISEVVRDPLPLAEQSGGAPHPKIPLPPDLYGPNRPNAKGLELDDPLVHAKLQRHAKAVLERQWQVKPVALGVSGGGAEAPVAEPSDLRRTIGLKTYADTAQVEKTITVALEAFPAWRDQPVTARADCLRRYADLLEQNMATLIGLCAAEAGKTFDDGIAEVREAVDFCRYYALQAEALQATATTMPGPTGEQNQLHIEGRGVFVCISPWNFPLAIFTGQVVAALVTGNCVIAKPAEQTSLMAGEAVRLMIEAGIPEGVISLLPGTGAEIGGPLVNDPRIAGVAFTGSTGTARAINLALAQRDG